jgi:hypothetical protein
VDWFQLAEDEIKWWQIWGFHGLYYEESSLLGCGAV